MSPMPIREAVRRLDAAGLVENIPHRGARVTELSITDLAEVYEARLALEVLAIRRAAERFDDGARAARAPAPRRTEPVPGRQLRRDLGRPRRVSLRAVRRRRLGVADAADPPGVGDGRALLPRDRRNAASSPQRDREHEAILEACVAHDPDRAAVALSDHLATTANNISVAMGGEPLFELSA